MTIPTPLPSARRHRVLMKGPLSADLIARLEADHTIDKLWEQPDPAAFLAQHGARFDVLATSGVFGASAGFIEQLPNLRLIASFGVGTDPIDLDAARARDIVVTNTPNVLNACVADMALGLLLALARRIVHADALLRSDQWTAGRATLGTKLGGKLCGIVGLGAIGSEIALRASAFGMRVAYHGPERRAGVDYPYYPSLLELARDADVLILSVPGGAATHHLVDARVLDALGPRGMLVNVARGPVVDERALIDALTRRAILGAALDVFEHEPVVPPALLALDNVVLTPHIASGTAETREAMTQLMLDNIAAFASGQPVLTAV